jgi:hypothetical protein
VQIGDSITVYVKVTALSGAEWEEWVSAPAKGGEEGEEGAPVPEAVKVKGGKANSRILIEGVPVAATVPAVAAHFQAWKGAAVGAAGTGATASTEAAREAAAAALRSAVLSNFRLVRDTVRQSVLPDVPCLRAGAITVAEDVDTVAGARLSVRIVRGGVWTDAAALQAAVASAASAAGVALADGGAAVARTAAAALCVRDVSSLQAELTANAKEGAPGLRLRVDGVPLALAAGVHFHWAPEPLLASSSGKVLLAAIEAEGGTWSRALATQA